MFYAKNLILIIYANIATAHVLQENVQSLKTQQNVLNALQHCCFLIQVSV